MNLVRPIATPGKPAAATLGLVDVDIHPRVRDLSEFRPFLTEGWGGVFAAMGNSTPSSSAFFWSMLSRYFTRAGPLLLSTYSKESSHSAVSAGS